MQNISNAFHGISTYLCVVNNFGRLFLPFDLVVCVFVASRQAAMPNPTLVGTRQQTQILTSVDRSHQAISDQFDYFLNCWHYGSKKQLTSLNIATSTQAINCNWHVNMQTPQCRVYIVDLSKLWFTTTVKIVSDGFW